MHRLQAIRLDLSELEALRLCDFEDHDQETAGRRMGVSRGTVQRLLSTGRKKVLQALPPKPVSNRVRYAIIMACTVMAGLICFLLLPAGTYLIEMFSSFLSPENGVSVVTHVILVATLAVLVWMPLTLAREEA